MKHIASLAITSVSLGLAYPAAASVAVGDNAELFVTAGAQHQSDSNIFLDAKNEKSDIIYSVTPGMDLVYGRGAITKGNFYYQEEIRRYSDNADQDTELSRLGATSSYNNGVTKVDLNASYAQVAQNDNDIRVTGDIVRRALTNLGALAEFGLSEKTALGVGASFYKTDYGPATYSDSDIISLPLDLYFKASPKLDWSVGYRYRGSELSASGADSRDNYLNIGARGEFSPKLIGQVRMGYNRRTLVVGGKEDQFGFNGNLRYVYSEKTSLGFLIGNDFGSSATGESIKNFNVGLNASSRLTQQWSMNAGLNFYKMEYNARTDDYTEAQVAIDYNYNTYVRFGASLTLRDNSSAKLVSAEFSQTVFSLGASVRY